MPISNFFDLGLERFPPFDEVLWSRPFWLLDNVEIKIEDQPISVLRDPGEYRVGLSLETRDTAVLVLMDWDAREGLYVWDLGVDQALRLMGTKLESFNISFTLTAD